MPSTPAQVAKKANVSVQSIRNWTKEYAELLSPEARGEMGTRLFSAADVEVLLTIAGLRRTGWPAAEILRHVKEGTIPAVVDVSIAPPQTAYKAPQQPTEASLAVFLAAHNTLQERVGDLARRIEARERHAWLWTLGMGVWIGMVLMGAIFFAVWLSVNGW